LRTAQWQPVITAKRSNGRFEIARPASGYVAFFGEATFGRGLAAFTLSTNLAVVAAAGERPYGTEPRGSTGVCTAVGGGPLLTAP
jgi:hypothetical protein